MHLLTNSSIKLLYSKRFFIVACFSAFFLLCLTYFSVPVVGKALSVLSALIFFGLMVWCLTKGEITQRQYNAAYEVTIFTEIFVISVSTFFVDKDFILFIPNAMAFLYWNVNVILKSYRVNFVAAAFIAVPFSKIVFFKDADIQYIGIITMFCMISYLTNILFRTNALVMQEAENRSRIIKELAIMMGKVRTHDMRNELSKMQCLILPEFRNDAGKFMDKMSTHMSSLEQFSEDKTFEANEPVDVKFMIEHLTHATQHDIIVFNCALKDNMRVFTNKSFLFSAIKNLIDNAAEAAYRRGQKANIMLVKDKNVISIIDDCGGFNAADIGFGHTSKSVKKGHGVFLSVITDPCIKFMFETQISINTIPGGTRVDIVFSRIESV